MNRVEQSYKLAQEHFAESGVDTEAAISLAAKIPVSLHCWQGDDVHGFESGDHDLAGGIQATGNYPGKARTANELRRDMEQVLSLVPGRHRVNLHAIYGEFGGRKVERDQIAPEHFAGWIEWCRQKGLGLDFNATFFSHPKADDGLTLSHPDPDIRKFWIEHAKACRRIAAVMGEQLGTPCVANVWVPDGMKDTPADRLSPRLRLRQSLDEIFAEQLPESLVLDSLESKLFGIGSESYVVGSHEFYLAYALANNKLLCLDAGHFHPTETISDKISSVLTFVDQILLHVSRGVRWDSDHVVTLDNELYAIAREIVANQFIDRVHVGLDFFDASINRIAAWTIGARNMRKALLAALLEPTEKIREAETDGDYARRLALMEECKSLPVGAVWDHFCERENIPVGAGWLSNVDAYEREVLSKR